MADETPAEREERLQKAEDRLQRAKERHKEEAAVPEKTRGGGGFGKAVAGIGSFFGEHKIIILAVVGFGIVAYIIYKSQSGATTANTANQQGSLAGQQDANTASALDSLQTQLNNLAATVSNIPAGPAGPAGPPGPVGGSGGGAGGGSGGGSGGGTGGTPPGTTWLWQQLHGNYPIIPSGQYKGPSFSNLKPGTKYTFNGITYTLTTSVKGMPGSGVLYGITNSGKVQTLYGPPSSYPGPQNLGVVNSIANHSPIYNFMKLAPEAVPGTDLSHSAVAFGPKNIRPIGFPNARAS